jgi:hypothetical protein
MSQPIGPPPVLPLVPVTFIYYDQGEQQKTHRAMCLSVPRVGEFFNPQVGSPLLTVHAVIYRANKLPDDIPAVVPFVYLREATEDERESLRSLLVPE